MEYIKIKKIEKYKMKYTLNDVSKIKINEVKLNFQNQFFHSTKTL